MKSIHLVFQLSMKMYMEKQGFETHTDWNFHNLSIINFVKLHWLPLG